MRSFAPLVVLLALSPLGGVPAYAQSAEDLDDLFEDSEPMTADSEEAQGAGGSEDANEPSDEEEDLFGDDDLFAELGLEEEGEGDDDGEGSSTQEDDTSGPSWLKSWKAFVESKGRYYLKDRRRGKNDEQWIFEGELELELRLADSISAYLRPRFLVDAVDISLWRLEPFEAYVDFRFEHWDLRVGQFVENWGIVDTFNPLDVINRRDFGSDFLDADRLGEAGVRARWFFQGGDVIGEPTLSLYVMPVWRRTPFAPEDQRFSFDRPGVPVREHSGFEPREPEEQVFVAARFESTLSTSPFNADLQVMAAHGPSRTPLLMPTARGLEPVYYGATVIGAGIRAVPNESMGSFLSTLTLKAEVAVTLPYPFRGSPIHRPESYVAYVFGVDRPFYDLILEQDSLTLTLEYAEEQGASDEASRFRPFRRDLIVRLFWEANDFSSTSLELRGIFDLDNSEIIVEGLFERRLRMIHNDLQVIAQVQYFDSPGKGRSLFDFFPDNTSVALALRWDFG